MTEKVVLGKKLVIYISNLEKIMDPFARTDGGSSIGVVANFWSQCIKNIAAYQHKSCASMLNLKRLIRVHHTVTLKFI